MKLFCLMLTVVNLIAACSMRGFSPPPSIEEVYTSRANPTLAEVKKALDDCGFGRPLQRMGNESLDNARARVNECIFLRGFYFKSGDGGYCADPEYRAKLPVCKNAPVRPRNGYYGQ